LQLPTPIDNASHSAASVYALRLDGLRTGVRVACGEHVRARLDPVHRAVALDVIKHRPVGGEGGRPKRCNFADEPPLCVIR
jgi:hypothetical protein